MLRSRRFAFAAAAVLLGLSACGESPRTTTPASAPVVIHIGSSSSGGRAESASADRMMMPWADITYVFDGSIPDLGANGLAWMLPAGVQPDMARIQRIAQLLGVEGEVRELPADQGGGWMVGAADYSTANLTVSTDGMLNWWFNPVFTTMPGEVCGYAVDTDTSTGSGGGTSGSSTDAGSSTEGSEGRADPTMPEPICEEPTPPANVPDEAAALAAAKQLFTEMGYDAGDYDYDVYADEWGANVSGYLLLDGHRSPISLSVGYGAEGALTWASGTLAEPQRASEYPLVGVEAGLVRLNEDTGKWMWYGGDTGVARMDATATGGAEGAATIDAVTDEAVAPPDQVGDPDTVVSQPVCDPATNCEVEEPMPIEPITVHLTGVTVDLTTIWAEDGAIWLLPAYTFTADDGGAYTVIAIDDSFIDLPDPLPMPEPMPVETLPIDTLPVETLPPDTGGETVAGDPIPDLVGLNEDEASKVAVEAGWTIRVVVRDGESLMVTADYSTTRINVEVADGVIVGVPYIG